MKTPDKFDPSKSCKYSTNLFSTKHNNVFQCGLLEKKCKCPLLTFAHGWRKL